MGLKEERINPWTTLHKEIYACKDCDRCKTRQINAPFFGVGNLNARIMFVGESPGYQTRQLNGITFCGNKSGDYFLEICAKHGFHAGNSYFTNVVKCQKQDNQIPNEKETSECRKHLKKEITLVDPEIIVCVGRTALNWFFPLAHMLHYIGNFEEQIDKRTITAIYHPSFILRTDNQKNYEKDFMKIKNHYLLLHSNNMVHRQHWLTRFIGDNNVGISKQ